jgi:hypothetical protein
MKFAMKGLSVLVAAGLLIGAAAVPPVSAGDKKADDQDIFKQIDSDLKKLDKELFGWLTPDSKKK